MVSVFEHSDYKHYLIQLEDEKLFVQRGFRSRLAEVLDCQNAFISQVLNTHAHFSLEQALKISSFLRHTKSETKFFLLLLEKARAGTPELQAYFDTELNQLREEFLNIKSRVNPTLTLTPEQEGTYYSSWIFPTLHMLVTIPQYRTRSKIEKSLKLPEQILNEALRFLIETGLVIEKEGSFLPGATQLHLGKNSPHIKQHHVNWRIAAVQAISMSTGEEIHYSTVSSLSKEDATKLRTYFVEVIQNYVKIVRPSKEETLYNFNLDFHELIRGG